MFGFGLGLGSCDNHRCMLLLIGAASLVSSISTYIVSNQMNKRVKHQLQKKATKDKLALTRLCNDYRQTIQSLQQEVMVQEKFINRLVHDARSLTILVNRLRNRGLVVVCNRTAGGCDCDCEYDCDLSDPTCVRLHESHGMWSNPSLAIVKQSSYEV